MLGCPGPDPDRREPSGFCGSGDLPQAPPPVDSALGPVAPVDLQSVHTQVRVTTGGLEVTSTATLLVGERDARPVLELRGYQEADAFADLLDELAAAEAAGTLAGRRPPPAKATAPRPLAAIRDVVVAQLDRLYDADEHGWGGPKKYPLAGAVEHALLRARLRGDAEAEWETRALATLDRELLLVDPVWGGVYQYSTGGVWTRPHYEKIAKVQAGSLQSFALAYRRTGDPRWRAAVDAQLGYLRDHLSDPGGGFYSSQDADLRDGERVIAGADYYAKTDAERRALGLPRTDRHIYADLNGRLIVALCVADASLRDHREGDGAPTEALELARAAAERLLHGHLRDDGSFAHDPDADDPTIYLRDQATVGRGLLALFESTGERRWLDHARALADRVLADLRDPERGGFFARSADPTAVGVFAERQRPLEDNGEIARFLLDLARLAAAADPADAGAEAYPRAAEEALAAVAEPQAIKSQGRVITSYLLALEAALSTSVDLTIVAADPRVRQRLHAAALAIDDPRLNVTISPPGARYPDIGRDAAYVCTDSACSSPITDADALASRVADFTADLDARR
ncbi:MAG: thioredoxin domain-containing protein [Myxococcales bacterium]|nr:thioredoxin domain-containing protein [Myxococcales bacterium]